MKRLIVVLCLATFLVALPMTHLALAKKAEKVKICHVIAGNDVIPFTYYGISGTLYFGKEITVAASAVDAHIAHGDSIKYVSPEAAAGPIQAFKDAGASLPATDCYFFVRD